jgi:CheY-like chemotaxis protein
MLDPVQLGQTLMNLAINARDAMQASGEIHVTLRAVAASGICTSCRGSAAGEFVELAVSDTGPGIPPSVQERMFEPFFTTKEVGQGSGMGLSTVHGIVHRHEGHIVVTTAPGAGACFRMLFPPLAAETHLPAEARVPSDVVPRATLSGCVAVVDDEVSVAVFMRELLAGWGLKVTTFADARMALDALRTGRTFDLVISDQTMPGMTGLEFARAARTLVPAMPIVLYTGFGDELGGGLQLKRAGVRAVLRKPIEPQALLTTLERNLPSPEHRCC